MRARLKESWACDLCDGYQCSAQILLCGHARYRQTNDAARELRARGHEFCCCAQNIAEFWNVSTRPADCNGLGRANTTVSELIDRVERECSLVYETAESFKLWRVLLTRFSVRGSQVHDARIAATLLGNGVNHLLTFNIADLKRYEGLIAVHPKSALTA